MSAAPASASSSPAGSAATRPWTRRRWLGASLAGLAAAGCDKFRLRSPLTYQEEIDILIWDNYLSADLIARFEKQASIRVNVHLFSTNDQLEGILTTRKFPYDLAMPSAFMAKRLLDAGLLVPFNHRHLPNLGHIDRKAYNPGFDPENAYVIPYIWGATGIGYNARRIEGLPKSWRDLFAYQHRVLDGDPGNISVLDDARFTIGSALIYLGFSPNTESPAEIERAAEMLSRRIQDIDYFESDRVPQLLAEEDVELALAWSADVTKAMVTNKRVRLSLPQEGSIVFRDSFVIPRSAKNLQAVQRFVNYLLDPTVAAAVTNYSLYATTLPLARPYVNRFITNGPSYFIHPAGRNHFLEDGGILDETYRRVWAQLKSQARPRTASAH